VRYLTVAPKLGSPNPTANVPLEVVVGTVLAIALVNTCFTCYAVDVCIRMIIALFGRENRVHTFTPIDRWGRLYCQGIYFCKYLTSGLNTWKIGLVMVSTHYRIRGAGHCSCQQPIS